MYIQTGLKVRGGSQDAGLAASRALLDAEWSMVQPIAEGLEWSYGWEPAAAQRMRFVLDFAYATGLQASELVNARLGMIEDDAKGDRWVHLVGKGSKTGTVVLPPMAHAALDRYLVQRRLPTTPARWDPATPLLGSLGQDNAGSITAPRLWAVLERFFVQVADVFRSRARRPPRSYAGRAPTGCATPTPPLRLSVAWVSPPCATTCVTHRCRLRRSTCTPT